MRYRRLIRALDVIVVDDFRGTFPLAFMLRLCQGHPFEAPTKGGHVFVAATTVVLVSNLLPHHQYPNEPQELRDAFFSRLETERNGHVLSFAMQDRPSMVDQLRSIMPASPNQQETTQAPSALRRVEVVDLEDIAPTQEIFEETAGSVGPSSPPMP